MTPDQLRRLRLRRMNMLMAYASFASTKAAAPAAFTPLSLFAANEQGVWYDPSDLTTLFQDAAGTTPVTGLEQPVGLMLDKSKGLVLGGELVSSWQSSSFWSVYNAGVVFNGTTMAFDALNDRCAAPTVFASGSTYKVTITLTATGGGTIKFDDDGTAGGPGTTTTYASAVGSTTTLYIRATSSNRFRFIQDSASGTVTVTGFTASLLPGNHASQSTAASRPVLSARYNLLTHTEAFDNAAWTKAGTQVTADQTAAPNGITTAEKVSANATGAIAVLHSPLVSIGSVSRTGSINLKPGTWRYVTFTLQVYSGTAQWVACTIDLNTGTITKTGAGAAGTYVSSSISAAANGFYLVTLTGVLPAGTDFAAIEVSFANSATPAYGDYGRVTVTGTSADYFYAWGADLRVSNDGVGIPSYQRVGAATDYDTTGFPMYIRADGTDDSLSTGSIDFSGTDKMSVVAGVRKLGGTDGCIYELSANWNTNDGAFQSFGTNPGFDAASRGNAAVSGTTQVASVAFTHPATAVLTATHDIAGDLTAHRLNGATAVNATGDKGTGNFGNYPLYIGSRGGSSLRFNGRMYGLLVIGRALTATEITNTETWMNQRTRAF